MKIVGFSPWQDATTSIAHSSDGVNGVVHKVVERPSSSSHASKRVRKHHAKKANSVLNMQPDLVLIADHQISILGHSAPYKTLKNADIAVQAKDSTIKELPQWNYNSRPGKQTSFLRKDVEKLGAVVDPNSRSVFSLQKSNTVLKIWSLDDDISGPEDDDAGGVHRVDLPTDAVSMESIPYKRSSHVKIKGHSSNSNELEKIQGGVTGLLSNGQVFVVLISSLKEVKASFYGKNDSTSSRKKSRKNRSNTVSPDVRGHHLFSMVEYAPSGIPVDKGQVGKKRKFENLSSSELSHGEITLSTLMLDPEKKGSILVTKHTIVLRAAEDKPSADGSKINGVKTKKHEKDETYKKRSSLLNLAHEINTIEANGNGAMHSDVPVHVTQLNSTLIGLVYQDTSKIWRATIIDTSRVDLDSQPFPLISKPSGVSIVGIGGLSTSIMAVLASDDCLTLYDVRRAVILHESNVRDLFDVEAGDKTAGFGISTQWCSGIVGIVRKSSSDDAEGNIQVKFAKIGIIDNDTEPEASTTAAKPSLKDSYNLARTIASSMVTTAGMELGEETVKVSPPEQNLMHWYEPSEVKQESGSGAGVEKLEKYPRYGQKVDASIEPLSSIFNDAISGKASIPQRVVDISVAIAVETILSPDATEKSKEDSYEVLKKCISSGKFSGRNHLYKATNAGTEDVFRALLFNIKKSYARGKVNRIENSPVHFVQMLLRYGNDALPEHMLVSMIHFVLCHISGEEFRLHYTSRPLGWYDSNNLNNVQDQLQYSRKLFEKDGESEEIMSTVQGLEQRLATTLQLFYIEKIVTNSKCNTALLRSAIREGLSRGENSEGKVFMKSLSVILRRCGSNGQDSLNVFSCVSKWLSAAIDSNLGTLMRSKKDDEVKTMKTMKDAITDVIHQTKALSSLGDLMDQASALQDIVDSPRTSTNVANLPPYGIESLIF